MSETREVGLYEEIRPEDIQVGDEVVVICHVTSVPDTDVAGYIQAAPAPSTWWIGQVSTNNWTRNLVDSTILRIVPGSASSDADVADVGERLAVAQQVREIMGWQGAVHHETMMTMVNFFLTGERP